MNVYGSYNDKSPVCIVCLHETTAWFGEVEGKGYWRCRRCQATWLASEHRLDQEAEKAIYDTHENDPDDPGYRQFLSRLTKHLVPRLEPKSCGLDYGCGPGPALASMLEEQGFSVTLFDPLYEPNHRALRDQYDFVTCTETAEHFFAPYREFARLNDILRPGGWLGVMTRFLADDETFANWHYRRDPTHVTFYKKETMHVLAQLFGWYCVIPEPNIALFRKSARSLRA